MKTLVVYYSRHGHAKKISEKIAKIFKADIEEIVDIKNRDHIISWSKSAFDEELRTPTKIKKIKHDPKDYDLVIIGTPIWDGISPPVWAYLALNKGKFKKVAFFATFNAAAENACYNMENLSGKKPIATLELQDRQVNLGEHVKKIEDFCKAIKKKI